MFGAMSELSMLSDGRTVLQPADFGNNISDQISPSENSSFIDIYEFKMTGRISEAPPVDVFYIINGICVPLVGLCGVFGNVLNVALLTWRYRQRDVEVLERSALLGLIALSLSDMCFCALLLPLAFYYRPRTLFKVKGFYYFYKVYGIYFQNIFIKTSTCLTMVIAAGRYIGICQPLRARALVGLFGTKVAIVATFLVWPLLLLPLIWTYSVQELPATNMSAVYLIDMGELATNHRLGQAFTYIWSIIGFFVPLAILSYCNVNLIRALRNSMRLHEAVTRKPSTGREANMRITMTLIVLVLMFTVLVSPSELLHFYNGVMEPDSYKTIEIATLTTNILQALNFAFHFVLYCAVNVIFRRTMVALGHVVLRKLHIRSTSKAATPFCAMKRASDRPLSPNLRSTTTDMRAIRMVETYV